MHPNISICLIITVLAMGGCASSRPSGSTTVDYNAYDEDLSATRPVYGASATPGRSPATTTRPAAPAAARKPDTGKSTAVAEIQPVNRRLDAVLDTIAAKNRSVRYAPGFRVQVYVGNKRQEVDETKLLLSQNFPELSPYLSYNQPTYKLKVGDFMRRIDAERYFTSIKQLIPSAQMQADKVDIRRSLSIK